MGFQAEAGGTRTYYSLLIDAARAEVEPMSEPRNAAHVLGVGTQIQSVNGPVFAAYFAASRERFDAQPNYKDGLFVLVDGAVYSVKSENIDTTIRRKFSTREFTLLRGDRPQRSVVYPWPWYREPFVSGCRRAFGRLHARDGRDGPRIFLNPALTRLPSSPRARRTVCASPTAGGRRSPHFRAIRSGCTAPR